MKFSLFLIFKPTEWSNHTNRSGTKCKVKTRSETSNDSKMVQCLKFGGGGCSHINFAYLAVFDSKS